MSNTPGNSDDRPAVPVLVEASGSSASSVPLLDDAALEPVPDAAQELAEAVQGFFENADLLARAATSAREAGDLRRADALVCAQAFRAEYEGDKDGAFGFWWSAFDRDPSLLIAFWGVRTALASRGDWQGVLAVLDRRILALAPPEASRPEGATANRAGPARGREEARAELWLSHGRILEDRLGRDDDAARSYRTGLIEAPGHVGLLLSLALLGWRRADATMTAEALTGLLRGTLSGAARAELTAAVARIERRLGDDSVGQPADTPVGVVAATRALETLRSALRVVGASETAPLIGELDSLLRATPDPLIRAEILSELVLYVPADRAEVAVQLLRARARLLREDLGDNQAAVAALRQALSLRVAHPLVIAELADLIEETGSDSDDGRVGRELGDLLSTVAPNDRALNADAEQQLALRLVTALGRSGHAQEGIALLARHPELRTSCLDADVLDVALRAMTGDVPGLIAHFDAAAERSGREGEPTPAADAHLIAGVLRELRAGEAAVTDDAGSALGSYEKAVAADPRSEIARDTLERHLWATRNWRALAQAWEARLATMEGLSTSARRRILEELTALQRDDLGDLAEAARFQDHLVVPGDARSRLRRLYLALAAAPGLMAAGGSQVAPLLRELGELAGVSGAQTALQVEAARVEAVSGNETAAEALFRTALSTDASGLAASGLERLRGIDAGGRADVVRAELARLGNDEVDLGRGVALRFRLAHHLCAAGRPGDAIEALEPLRTKGNAMAVALAWEIARRSGNAELETAVLEATSESGGEDLQVHTDLPEAQEATGEMVAAADGYRAALRAAPSADAALGLFRVGAKGGDPAVVIEASRALEAFVDSETKGHLTDDAEMLTVLSAASASVAPGTKAAPRAESGAAGDESHAVLRWASGITSREVVSVSAGLLALARALPPDEGVDRNGLLARAAARARLGGAGLAGAVHDQAYALSGKDLSIDVGLSDLPVAGRPERAGARAARANRTGGRLGYALDLERGVDAESRGDGPAALQAFTAAVARTPDGIEALDGIRRMTLATGNHLGAARAGMRLGAVLRTPHLAALEFRRAATIWHEEGMVHEAKIAYWQALALAPESSEVFECLRDILRDDGEHADLERLLSVRLGVLNDPLARLPILVQRAFHRLERLAMPEAAIQDFKRILKIEPTHLRSLRAMATLALDGGQAGRHVRPAIRYLEQLLKVETDGAKRGEAWLELGEAYQAVRDPRRAQEALREAVAARPDDVVPRQRLVDFLLRSGDWSAALTALRVWESTVMEPAQKAAIWIRIGTLLRDHGSVKKAAEPAFAMAADLDPLGEGVFELAELHTVLRDPDSRRHVLSEAVVDFRRLLQNDPLDVPRLRRLRELYQRLADGPGAGPIETLGAQIVGQVLALFGENGATGVGRGRLTPRAGLGADFWSRLRAPGAGGFAGEIWTKIAAGASEMFPAADAGLPARDRVAPGTEPRISWIEGAAMALGLPSIELALAKQKEPPDDSVRAIETGPPSLVAARGVLAGDAAARFKVGRALSLLHERSMVLERLGAAEIAVLFNAASVVAGARARADVSDALAEQAKILGRAVGRKNRKALELEVSRFGFETIDPSAFAAGTRATADRLGLLFCGDVEVAVGVLCNRRAGLTPELIANDERARELLRFALSEDFLTLRLDAAAGEG